MDIAIVGKNSLKLRGKQVTFVVDPASGMPKTTSDAIILLNGNGNIDTSRVTDSRIIINGAGGYEVGGTKISATKTPKGIFYELSMDNINVFLGHARDTKTEGFNACQVAIINTDGDFNESFVTALEPKIAILYGEKKIEAAKTLGAETVSPVSKVTIAKDKLPEKMQVIILASS